MSVKKLQESEFFTELKESIFAREIDGFIASLRMKGYADGTIYWKTAQISHFSHYLKGRGICAPSELKSSHFGCFKDLNHQIGLPRTLTLFYDYLKDSERFDGLDEFSPPSSNQIITTRFLNYLKDYRNPTEYTLMKRRRYISKFLNHLGEVELDELSHIKINTIQRFVFDYGESHGLYACGDLVATLRAFFHFCHHQGYMREDISKLIPTIHRYRFSHVPPVINDKHIETLLTKIDRSTRSGIRDYAIILILATYGVRGVQLRGLKLRHINWRSSQIRFPAAKGGKAVTQFLTVDTGEALYEYIHDVRQNISDHQEVFLTLRAPVIPLNEQSLYAAIAERFRLAEIEIPMKVSIGANFFRHAFASRMISNGESLKTISDMLGHRRIETTYIYTKVDFNNLREIVMEWPEVIS